MPVIKTKLPQRVEKVREDKQRFDLENDGFSKIFHITKKKKKKKDNQEIKNQEVVVNEKVVTSEEKIKTQKVKKSKK